MTELHADQARKGDRDLPYISHLLAVAALTLEDGGDESDAIVALCHDAVEDQGGEATLAEVRDRFGEDVARGVDLLSDSRGGRDEPKAPWRERKEGLLDQLRQPGVPDGVLRVAAADKLHNARSSVVALRRDGPVVWERFRAEPADYVWFYRAIADLIRERLPDSGNGAELARAVDELAGWLPGGEVSRPA
jgi:(p)ppGpp synthase/HD superfamily hydrolase